MFGRRKKAQKNELSYEEKQDLIDKQEKEQQEKIQSEQENKNSAQASEETEEERFEAIRRDVDEMSDEEIMEEALRIEASLREGFVAESEELQEDIDVVSPVYEPIPENVAEAAAMHPDFKKEELSPEEEKTCKTKRRLITVIILLIVLTVALVCGIYALVKIGFEQANQDLQGQDNQIIKQEESQDATGVATKTIEVPHLIDVFGLTSEEALETIGKGAVVGSESKADDKKEEIQTFITAPLADEPIDSRTGSPTVYLGLDKEGKVIKVGYSTSTASLGFKQVSFADAVQQEKFIQKTFEEAGLIIPDDQIVLPEDSSEYTQYVSGEDKVSKESYEFKGEVTQDDVTYEWTSVLSYDYRAANTSGNLADTIKQINIHIQKK